MSTVSTRPHLRIGGASGFWGDSSLGAPQLVNSGLIDVLVFDYLAETTMAILAAAPAQEPRCRLRHRLRRPGDAQVLPEVVKRGIKVITNAGGINPQACAARWPLADELGLSVKIAVVEKATTCALPCRHCVRRRRHADRPGRRPGRCPRTC
jgi:hypothetical protein